MNTSTRVKRSDLEEKVLPQKHLEKNAQENYLHRLKDIDGGCHSHYPHSEFINTNLFP